MDFNNLVWELNEVVEWEPLGLEMKVPHLELQKIRRDYNGVEACKTHIMLSTWLDHYIEPPTWADVVRALVKTGNRRVAQKIANKYGRFLTNI